MSASLEQSGSGDGNPTPAKKQRTDSGDTTTIPSSSSSIPFASTTPIQPGTISFTISNGALTMKPVTISENATPTIGIQPTNALPGTVTMVKGVNINPSQTKIPNPNPLQQIRTAFVPQNSALSSSTAATTITVRPGMTFMTRPGYPMQAIQTVQPGQAHKTLKGQATSQVQLQPQQIQINQQAGGIKVVQGHMSLGQVSLTQFTQANPTSVNQSSIQFSHKLQPQLVTKILPNISQLQSQPIQVKQLAKNQQIQINQGKGIAQIPLVVTQLSQNSQQTSAPKVTTTLTQSQAPVMQTWTLTQIPQGIKGQDISKQVNLNPTYTLNPISTKIQPQANLPRVLSPVSPQTKSPMFPQVKAQGTEIQIRAQLIPDAKQGLTTQIKLPIPSNSPNKTQEPIVVKPVQKLVKESPVKSLSTATSKPQSESESKDKTTTVSVSKESVKPTDSINVKQKEKSNQDATQQNENAQEKQNKSVIPTVVFDASASVEQKKSKSENVESEEKKNATLESEASNEIQTKKADNSTKTKPQTSENSVLNSEVIKNSDGNDVLKNEPVKQEKNEEKMDISEPKELESVANQTIVKQEERSEKLSNDSKMDESKSEVVKEANKMEVTTEDKEEKDDKEESVTGDFDAVGAMNWENGIGTLEGSDLRFKMNEFGVLEVVTDDLECAETLNLSSESEDSKSRGAGDADDSVDGNKTVKDKDGASNALPSSDGDKKDEVCQCENCGEYGFSSEFCKNGRFCSQECLGSFTSKHMRGMKRQIIVNKMMQGIKKKKKKLLDDEEEFSEFKGVTGKKKSFNWNKYMEEEKAIPAPEKCFKDAFPSQKNGFKVGMRMEGVDPKHQSLFCVLSVAEVCGYRLRLHFDGYSECYDYWTNADSPFIFPAGFCEKNGRLLQPPKGFNLEGFNWTSYLKLARAIAAPKHVFSNQPVQAVTPSAFRAHCKLEAVDKKNNNLICVATVIDTMGDKVLVHFDGWEDTYDYWCDITSPNIHHVNWCSENGLQLSPPNDWKEGSPFSWESFLSKKKTSAVPARAFKPRSPLGFEKGMKVEVVDRRNPILVRVATISDTMNHLIKIHFDGWADIYDYWLDDDSPDIHPPGWCDKTGHPLTPPIDPTDLVAPGQSGCPTPGCKGIGHIKGAKYIGHHSHFGCPYSSANMNKESTLQDRLGSTRAEECSQTPNPSPTNTVSTKIFKQMEQNNDSRNGGIDTTGRVRSQSMSNQNHQNIPTPTPTPPPTPPSKSKLVNGEPKVRTKSTRGRKPRSYYLNMGDRAPKPLPAGKTHHHKDKDKDKSNLHNGIHQSVFMSAMVSNPNKDLPLCWEQHSKLLPGVNRVSGNDVTTWSIDQVTNFVKTLPSCEEHAKVFKEEQIDGEAFLLMTQTDIVKIMNIKLGPALKIYNSILMFKNSVDV